MELSIAQPPLARSSVIRRCEHCVFLKSCGGKSPFGDMWNCFDKHPYDAGDDDVCPSNPDFVRWLTEVHGLTFDEMGMIRQRGLDLPSYVPHLNHQYCRLLPPLSTVVSISPYQLFRCVKRRYATVATNARELREFFGLAPGGRVILLGTNCDRPLERYWSNRRIDHAAEQLARLGVDLMIAPNFSHFGDATRTDHLFNRKRQLICLTELHDAGVNVAPHLSAAVDADWDFWGRYLEERPTISIVAKEFQTGNKKKEHGLHCLERMDAIQDRLGRRLHPILIGGAHLTEDAAMRFQSFTVLDSRPFQNAVHRHSFEPKGRRPRWISRPRLPGFRIDDLVTHNFERYSEWILLRTQVKASTRFLNTRVIG